MLGFRGQGPDKMLSPRMRGSNNFMWFSLRACGNDDKKTEKEN